jgi:hypothetical protein
MRDSDVISGDQILAEGLYLDESLGHEDRRYEGRLNAVTREVKRRLAEDETATLPRPRPRPSRFVESAAALGLDGAAITEGYVAEDMPRRRRGARRRSGGAEALREAIPGFDEMVREAADESARLHAGPRDRR